MPSRSKITKLDPAIREELDKLLKNGRYTIRDITTHLQQLGADISRGSVHRYSQKFERLVQRARETREITSAFARELGDVPDSAATTMLAETLTNFLLHYTAEADGEDRQVEPKEIMMMARAVKDLASATRVSSELEMKIADRVAKEAASRVEKKGKELGLSRDIINRIRGEILGIQTPKRPDAVAEDEGPVFHLPSNGREPPPPPPDETPPKGRMDVGAANLALEILGFKEV